MSIMEVTDRRMLCCPCLIDQQLEQLYGLDVLFLVM